MKDQGDAGTVFNEPLLFTALEKLLRPDIPPDGDIIATSTVLAGWIGLFVTALNLLPVGQLDGGHVVYALLGRGQHVVGLVTVIALACSRSHSWSVIGTPSSPVITLIGTG